jgi:acetyltransferase-like isoleucine patch superfamily enzyme
MLMSAADLRSAPSRAVIVWRIAWTVISLVAVQTIVLGASAAPIVAIWQWLSAAVGAHPTVRWAAYCFALGPSYALFAMCLMVASPLALRLLRWHTPPDAEMRIADFDWALLRWVRFVASIHVVRIIAGALFRGTPIWTSYLRLNGARLGKRVYVNSLSVSDYNLIECGADVVIGGGVHLSGHTVEAGLVKTAHVTLGDNVTIGLGSVIEIGVEIGSGAEVGALSFVPKHTKLKGGLVYVGAPAKPLE